MSDPYIFRTAIEASAAQNLGALAAPWGNLYVNAGKIGILSGAVIATAGVISAESALSPLRGGTGISSYIVGDLLYANTAASLAKLADVATGNVLISGGVGVAPSWDKVGLTTHVSGTLAAGNGGTENAFFQVSGPATSIKTFTFPNSSATVLTTANVVTEGQGGTGQTTYATGDILYASTTNTLSKLAGNPLTTRKYLYSSGNGSVNNTTLWDTISKTEVGLGNVENTALSTWTGSTSITTLGTIATGTWNATTIGVGKGGTGLTSIAAFAVYFASATDTLTTLAPNITTTKKFLRMTGTGAAGQAPAWDTVDAGDITSGVLGVPRGGIGTSSFIDAGRLLYSIDATTLAVLAIGDSGDVLKVSGGFPVWSANSITAADVGAGTFTGAFTFGSTITGSITGNAGSVTNGIYTTNISTYAVSLIASTARNPGYTSDFWNTGGEVFTSLSGNRNLTVYNSFTGSVGDAFMTFHNSGDFALYFGLGGVENDLMVGGWSMGAVRYRIWHSGNDGSTSGLDADLLDGYHVSATYAVSTVMVRDANGYSYANYYNMAAGDEAGAASHYIYMSTSDGWMRRKTLANVKTEIVTTTAVNSAAATTVGTVTSGTWSATAIQGDKGGTGLTSFTQFSILYANTTTTWSTVVPSVSNTFLKWDGAELLFAAVAVAAANVTSGTFPSGAFAFTTSVNSPIYYVSSYLVWSSGNPSGNGMIRMVNNQYIGWRDAANSANYSLGVNASNRLAIECGIDFGTSLGQIYGFYDTAMTAPATTYSHLRFGDGGFMWRDSASNLFLMNTLFYNSSGLWKYLRTSEAASVLSMPSSGDFDFYTAPSGTAGNTATITMRMQLTNSAGDLIVTGDVTSYGTPSDRRLKDNLKVIEKPFDILNSIHGYTFDWNEKSSHWTLLGSNAERHDMGVLAQEVENVLPYLVKVKENGYKSVRGARDPLVSVLIEAVKELRRDLDVLQSR